MTLQAPFPFFGGKSRVAHIVWERFGDVPNYVECFAGSLAVLIGRPHSPRTETVNDLDGFAANFWRSVKLSPDATAEWAENPVNENDLHARHAWLLQHRESLRPKLEGDPDFHDPKIAGWWAWGCCAWIGSGWCSGDGPWGVADGLLVNGAAGQDRKRPDLGNAGKGVNRQLPHLGTAGSGVNCDSANIREWFARLSARLARVRVASGDWSRVCGPSVTFKHGVTGVFLDPPYSSEANRDENLYSEDCNQVARDVKAWAVENGSNPLLRIALCGYDGEHNMPDDWTEVAWKAKGGYGNQSEDNINATRERIWFSPACENARQGVLL